LPVQGQITDDAGNGLKKIIAEYLTVVGNNLNKNAVEMDGIKLVSFLP